MVRKPSGAMPPPGTIMWTWGWWVSVEPQVCRTDVMPMLAPSLPDLRGLKRHGTYASGARCPELSGRRAA